MGILYFLSRWKGPSGDVHSQVTADIYLWQQAMGSSLDLRQQLLRPKTRLSLSLRNDIPELLTVYQNLLLLAKPQ